MTNIFKHAPVCKDSQFSNNPANTVHSLVKLVKEHWQHSQNSIGTLLGERVIFTCKWQAFNVGRLIIRCGFLSFNAAAQPFFIFGHGKAIHRMGLDGKNQRRLVAGVGRSIFLDFHFRDGTIYWADKKTGVIYKAAVRDAQRQVINQSELS